MTEQQFWEFVDASRTGWNPADVEASRERQAARLKRLLKPLSTSQLIAFERRFRMFHKAAYHWDLWAAAYWFQSGCSDDGFHYFRYWLLSMGREVYEAALENSDSLADVFSDLDEADVEFEDFGYVCDHVYKARTGRYMSEEELFPLELTPIEELSPPTQPSSPAEPSPDTKPFVSPQPRGKPYPEDSEANEAEFARRMPRLYAQFMAGVKEFEAAQKNEAAQEKS